MSEYNKHIEFLKKSLDKWFFYRTLDWLTCDIRLIKDFDIVNNDKKIPILILVVHEELDKLRIQFNHYKKLGIKNIIVVANNSPKNVIDYVSKYQNVCIFGVNDKYSDKNKNAWVQRIIAKFGQNKWYLVADVDELFDYIGRENNTIDKVVSFAEYKGYDKLYGYMLDMYSAKGLYSERLNWDEIENDFCYFDNDTYYLESWDENNVHKSIDVIWGGFRQRIFGIRTLLSKESLFKYKENMIYETHYIHPLDDIWEERCYYVLRHYKFLYQDKEEYHIRAQHKNFAENGAHYKRYVDDGLLVDHPRGQNSLKYINSLSLKNLPYIKDCFKV